MAEKKQQQEALNVEEALSKSEAFLIKNKKTIIGVIVAIIVIIAAVVLYKQYYAEPREEKAYEALFKGEEYFEAGNFEMAIAGDSIEYLGFQDIIDNYGGTKAANLAKAYLGISHAQLGQNEAAIKVLSEFDGDDQMVSPALKGTMGNCYAKLGNLDKAVALLQEAAKEADNNTLSPIFLQQAGEILLSQGKGSEALKAFTTIKEKYFRSIQSMEVDKYIEKANLLNK